MPKRLGFFTRLLDQGSAQTRYRLAAEQIRHVWGGDRFCMDGLSPRKQRKALWDKA
ncbi:hypothetical protein RAF30_11725 [Klebsiella quasipneumoniae subsp. similipneumoniae]